ncbi:MAG: cyclic nucleotide-binding domain-containing protein [Elusimicrobia bacterium]|nr:cyclic nucleotide-binding domain-containing protein [Elusimicrobiota bacterium]
MGLSPIDIKWLFEKLRKIDFLAYHSEDELAVLVQSMKSVKIQTSKTILKQGQKGSAYYIIRSGSVDIWADAASGRIKLATLREGDSFGEVSVLTGELCNATVTAKDDVEVFAMPAEGLRRVVRANPLLAAKMAETIAKRKGARALGLEPAAAKPEKLLSRLKAFLGG